MTKSKTSMVTRDILYLTIVTLLDVVVKSNYPLLSVGWYLFWVVTGNRYLPRGSNENSLCSSVTGSVSVARWVISLVTILLMDLVMIHWIRWIQRKSFRENSIRLITARKRSLRRLCFYTCLSVILFTWGVYGCGRGHAWLWGGMCGCGCVRGIWRDTVNERAVRILLECILVLELRWCFLVHEISVVSWSCKWLWGVV